MISTNITRDLREMGSLMPSRIGRNRTTAPCPNVHD